MLSSLKEFVLVKIIDPAVGLLSGSAKAHLVSHSLGRDALESVARTSSREMLAATYLRGEGLEVGGLNAPLKVPDEVKVRYVDLVDVDELQKSYPDFEIKRPDIVANGETLDCVGDGSQDFVIANHFLEHCEDPIGALKNFLRVVRRGGVVFVAIPDKRFTFDVRRDVTTFEHLLKDHEEGGAWSRLGHFEDYHRVVLGVTDERQIRRDMEEMGHTHYHVWTQVEMLEMFVRLRKDLSFDFEVEAFLNNRALGEGIIVLRKGAAKNTDEGELSCINVVREDYRKRYPDFGYEGAPRDG
jgi:predicted SAM-dependent methyltransferase